jgi:hypothetical protein
MRKLPRSGSLQLCNAEARGQDGFHTKWIRVFLDLPKTRHGHVRTRQLVARVHQQQQELWETHLSPPAQIFDSLCFHHWMHLPFSRQKTVSLDALWPMARAWQREKCILNTYNYPGKVVYNECVRHYHAQEYPPGSGEFVLLVMDMLGGAWREGLRPHLRMLWEGLQQKHSLSALMGEAMNESMNYLKKAGAPMPMHLGKPIEPAGCLSRASSYDSLCDDVFGGAGEEDGKVESALGRGAPYASWHDGAVLSLRTPVGFAKTVLEMLRMAMSRLLGASEFVNS